MRNLYLQDRSHVCNAVEYPNEPRFVPSLVSECLFTSSDDGLTKFHSDIHMILRDKQFVNNVGPDVFRSFVNDLSSRMDRSRDVSDLTDDQLMDSILDRRLRDATDVYQFARRFDDHIDDYKARINQYRESRKRDKQLRDSLLKSNTSE